jgi:hypothetical protein
MNHVLAFFYLDVVNFFQLECSLAKRNGGVYNGNLNILHGDAWLSEASLN